MGVIKLLDEQVSQLIAAGEVVERPSSVVKELVENSIDAGASKITVEVRHGGVTLIRVSDNGSGIAPEDVPMMFLRHATSKVHSQEDLSCIATLGFRGEAMASIHAVARVEVLTRKQGTDEGVHYSGEGDQMGQVTPAGCPAGTTVKVADLFFNTPARMKFLKKDVQEGNAVAAVVERIALSHPEISFQLIREGQTRLHTPGDGKLLSAIHAVFGKDFVKGLAEVNYTQGQLKVSGYVSLPAACRSNRTMQTFFVNGRYVKSMTARTAMEEAYKHSIMVGKFPACVLNLEIPYTETDINVHPAKIEVRFTNERPVFDTVYYGVKNALKQQDYTPLPKQPAKKMTVFDLQRRPEVEQTQLKELVSAAAGAPPVQHMSAQEYRSWAQQQSKGGKQSSQSWQRPKETAVQHQTQRPKQAEESRTNVQQTAPKSHPRTEEEIQSRLKELPDETLTFHDHDRARAQWELAHPIILVEEPHFPKEEEKASAAPKQEKAAPAAKQRPVEQQSAPNRLAEPKPAEQTQPVSIQPKEAAPKEKPDMQLRLVGEVLGTYLVVEGEDKLILIDKHAAHERLIFNRLKQQRFTDDRQLLLEPVMVHLSREDYQGATQNLSVFQQAGFLVEDFGDGDLIVREVPVLLSGAQVQEIVEKTAHDLAKNKKDLTPEALDELLHSVACKSAVRANDKNTLPELWEIIQLLQEDENAKYCPHGRPVARILTRRELEKMFGRLG